MKLEFKHFKHYLDTGLKVVHHDGEIETPNYSRWQMIMGIPFSHRPKLLLHPLSDLAKEIEHNGEEITWPETVLNAMLPEGVSIDREDLEVEPQEEYPATRYIEWIKIYGVMEKLFEWHFDVYGLIEQGLAVNINTLNK